MNNEIKKLNDLKPADMARILMMYKKERSVNSIAYIIGLIFLGGYFFINRHQDLLLLIVGLIIHEWLIFVKKNNIYMLELFIDLINGMLIRLRKDNSLSGDEKMKGIEILNSTMDIILNKPSEEKSTVE